MMLEIRDGINVGDDGGGGGGDDDDLWIDFTYYVLCYNRRAQ